MCNLENLVTVMAKRFSELGIKQQDDRKIFNCQQVSITDILNSEIEVLVYIPDMKTQHGEGRYLIHYRENGTEGKFFSNSGALKSVLDQIPKEEFPFITTIRYTKCGNGKIYQFT